MNGGMSAIGHETDVPRRPRYRRYRGKIGSDMDIVKPT
jgi:hypothetical protein